MPSCTPGGLLTCALGARIAIVLMKRENALRVTSHARSSHARTCGAFTGWTAKRTLHGGDCLTEFALPQLATCYKKSFGARGLRDAMVKSSPRVDVRASGSPRRPAPGFPALEPPAHASCSAADSHSTTTRPHRAGAQAQAVA